MIFYFLFFLSSSSFIFYYIIVANTDSNFIGVEVFRNQMKISAIFPFLFGLVTSAQADKTSSKIKHVVILMLEVDDCSLITFHWCNFDFNRIEHLITCWDS